MTDDGQIARLHEALSEYAERINEDARDCAYRDRLIEKMRAVLVKVHAYAPDVETSHEIAFLLELPVTRKDDAYKSEIDLLREELRVTTERVIADLKSHVDR